MPDHNAAVATSQICTDAATRQTGPLVDVVIEGGDWSEVSAIQRMVDETAGALAQTDARFAKNHRATLALSSDARVAELNERFRGRPVPTNVLSFPSPTPTAPDHNPTNPGRPGAPHYLGDIVMAAQTMSREADGLGIPLDDHFRHLLLHGLLHLLGFDHETDEDARNMEAIEIKVLRTMGIANPYSNAPRS